MWETAMSERHDTSPDYDTGRAWAVDVVAVAVITVGALLLDSHGKVDRRWEDPVIDVTIGLFIALTMVAMFWSIEHRWIRTEAEKYGYLVRGTKYVTTIFVLACVLLFVTIFIRPTSVAHLWGLATTTWLGGHTMYHAVRLRPLVRKIQHRAAPGFFEDDDSPDPDYTPPDDEGNQ